MLGKRKFVLIKIIDNDVFEIAKYAKKSLIKRLTFYVDIGFSF